MYFLKLPKFASRSTYRSSRFILNYKAKVKVVNLGPGLTLTRERVGLNQEFQFHWTQAQCLARLHTSSQACTQHLTWSYVHGASTIPLMGITIGKQLQKMVESQPNKVAMIFAKEKIMLTFVELLNKVDMLAAGFKTLGIRHGDRVGVWGPNSIEWVLTQYGTARAGNILVNINPSYRKDELKYALQKSGCKGLVAAPGCRGLDYINMLKEIIPEMNLTPYGAPITSKELPNLKYIFTMGSEKYPGTLCFDDFISLASPSEREHIMDVQNNFQFDDPINIQFTSDSVICIPVPLYHCFGMVMGCLQSITHGATVVFPSPLFDPASVLSAVETYRCTSLYGVPTMFIDILNHPMCDKTDLSTLITGIMAGSPCPIETVRDVLKRMNMEKFTVCYGSTETSPVSFQSTGMCSLDKRVSTVGKVLDHIEAKIVDSDGRVVPIGVPGELCTRGPSTMLGYWDDPEKTKQAVTLDKWYHTGDLAVMTEEGYCSIVGRIKDMLIRGGENIYPLEIEQIMYEHPQIKDVQVIGVPDARLGEQVCAWIIVKSGMTLTVEEVKEFCKDKMARYKIPHYILFVDDFPKTVTGKIQKFIMREESIKILGLPGKL
ncbi:medium-chain acyl-CoA ligase ACSF2, mitochondrial-like isoform X2 [Biomphalaria glabrata]|uniref:Medium-chain acyl-CoA ligase ACSF2, mitochondrial n=1 Tax=Biomphalaria glabrata TaxID=6526 RepID=A0A9W3B431_BIOGL|nr:medium-chain acyl-CoA ligase ACSF2, mitochondrial-like isoform X2 [Biomphalaria glabrata]